MPTRKPTIKMNTFLLFTGTYHHVCRVHGEYCIPPVKTSTSEITVHAHKYECSSGTCHGFSPPPPTGASLFSSTSNDVTTSGAPSLLPLRPSWFTRTHNDRITAGLERGHVFFFEKNKYRCHPRKSGEPGSMSPVTGKNAWRPEKRRFESNILE